MKLTRGRVVQVTHSCWANRLLDKRKTWLGIKEEPDGNGSPICPRHAFPGAEIVHWIALWALWELPAEPIDISTCLPGICRTGWPQRPGSGAISIGSRKPRTLGNSGQSPSSCGPHTRYGNLGPRGLTAMTSCRNHLFFHKKKVGGQLSNDTTGPRSLKDRTIPAIPPKSADLIIYPFCSSLQKMSTFTTHIIPNPSALEMAVIKRS